VSKLNVGFDSYNFQVIGGFVAPVFFSFSKSGVTPTLITE
jgi:hypothetical protein